MTAGLTLVAFAPSGDAGFVTEGPQLWLVQYPKPRRSDKRELAWAISEGFVPCEEPMESPEALENRLNDIRKQWIDRLSPAEDYLSQYNSQTVRRMLETLERSVVDGRSEPATLQTFAARMLYDCPAVLSDAALHKRLLDALGGASGHLVLPRGVESEVMDRVLMQLAA